MTQEQLAQALTDEVLEEAISGYHNTLDRAHHFHTPEDAEVAAYTAIRERIVAALAPLAQEPVVDVKCRFCRGTGMLRVEGRIGMCGHCLGTGTLRSDDPQVRRVMTREQCMAYAAAEAADRDHDCTTGLTIDLLQTPTLRAQVERLRDQWRSEAEYFEAASAVLQRAQRESARRLARSASAYRTCASELDAVLAPLAQEPPQWQPIETAPKDGRQILLTDGKHVSQGWWGETHWLVWEHPESHWDFVDGLTGWMPLPAPRETPEEPTAGEETAK